MESPKKASFGLARSLIRHAAEREDLSSHVLRDKAGLSAVRKQIRADLSRNAISASPAFDCLVAVTEACTQALIHSDHEEEGRRPRISWEISEREALFFIRDYSSKAWARATHPSSAPTPREDDLDQRLESLGLHLMRGLMDDVRIEMQGTGTTIVLVKTLGPSR